MIFKHKPLSESIVMKEFEKVAVSKGLVKGENLSKTASIKSSLNPTDSLFIDMINLATGLREQGFEKEAESLEEKLFVYKQAEAHLYRAVDEDADDLLDFAH